MLALARVRTYACKRATSGTRPPLLPLPIALLGPHLALPPPRPPLPSRRAARFLLRFQESHTAPFCLWRPSCRRHPSSGAPPALLCFAATRRDATSTPLRRRRRRVVRLGNEESPRVSPSFRSSACLSCSLTLRLPHNAYVQERDCGCSFPRGFRPRRRGAFLSFGFDKIKINATLRRVNVENIRIKSRLFFYRLLSRTLIQYLRID